MHYFNLGDILYLAVKYCNPKDKELWYFDQEHGRLLTAAMF